MDRDDDSSRSVDGGAAANRIPPSAPDSPTSAWFNTEQLPFNISQNYCDDDNDDEAYEGPVFPKVDILALYKDKIVDDYRRMRIDDSDEMDEDQIMIELDAKAKAKESPVSLLPDQVIIHGMAWSRSRMQRRNNVFKTHHPYYSLPFVGHLDGEACAMYKVKGPLREWVARDEVRRFIYKKFLEFLITYIEPGSNPKYIEDIRWIKGIISANKCSLEFDWLKFNCRLSRIGLWLQNAPQPVLEVMEEAVDEFVFTLYPDYRTVHPKIYVRITNPPLRLMIQKFRQKHLNTMVVIGGVVTQRSGVFPQLVQVKYECSKCGAILGPFVQNSQVKVGSCPKCQSKGPFTVNIEQTIYRNYQKLTLGESPIIKFGGGRLPGYKEVILLHDLIDCVQPGDDIVVHGICYKFDMCLNTKNGLPVSAIVVEANSVAKLQDIFAASRKKWSSK